MSNHRLDELNADHSADDLDVEELLLAEARVVEDMVSTHDTADFMSRLAKRIAAETPRPPRVRRATGGDSDRGREPATAQPPTARHDAVRPRSRRARRRRPLPIVHRNLLSHPRATQTYLLEVCETVLCSQEHEQFDLYERAGARTFACLLYLLGRRHSAVFWWGFAAGADDALAAHLLATHYAIDNTGLNQARAWRWYARFLGYRRRRHLPQLIQDIAPPRDQIAADLVTNYPWTDIMRTFIDNPRLVEM
ncbi:hypothetical protein EOT10_04035 [Streptomyces antnestii]|uniref:Uncharacterized protein n=1 Tax=Streptomyces antnestii TaxID=2494256 RepID=A0A3S2VJM6_9ACTN|nr:hypothetical protein [Streptomyces sp. San01]RVU29014.1 hypothetical protein EOT10_04035 [Streptomyces sp. San01]